MAPDLEQKLRNAERALERSERLALASSYAGAIMHEVNNPLEAITNLVYLSKLQKNEPEQVLQNMLVIEEQLQMLGNVTSQALTFHREQPEAKELDLVEIAESALTVHANRFARHGVAVHRRFRGPAVTRMHGSEILQVISNLLLNAIDVLSHGHGHVYVCVKSCPHFVHLTVTDNGPGVPESFQSTLFEPYITSKATGTGLGLWLSRRIVERHSGSLRFRTSRHSHRRGTTFRLSLPAKRAA